VVLFASLIKKDKFEWVLEKCTELGVSEFVPVISERSEKKGLNIERARKIIKEASEQSEENDSDPVPWKNSDDENCRDADPNSQSDGRESNFDFERFIRSLPDS
jgi:RsmE family RNA methyltransferase